LGVEVSFGRWMLLGLPTSLLSILVVWTYLVHVAIPVAGVQVGAGEAVVTRQLAERGLPGRDEIVVASVFALTALGWLTRGLFWKDVLPLVSDATIAIGAGLVLFLLPARAGG